MAAKSKHTNLTSKPRNYTQAVRLRPLRKAQNNYELRNTANPMLNYGVLVSPGSEFWAATRLISQWSSLPSAKLFALKVPPTKDPA